MAAKLEKPIRRELALGDKLYTVTLSPDGVKIVEKGHRKGHELSWDRILSGDAELTEGLRMSVDAYGGAGGGAGGGGTAEPDSGGH